ncbi:uncharacterized protein [Euwallacea fornicatus]|uniref:uncharacterized protein n=1 Tax=Euwallacea fornicatus TaxID=995702 RepID=UPI00338E22F4
MKFVVLDMQGYIINKMFTVKELAIYDDDRKTVEHLYNHVHGIPFDSGDVEYEQIEDILEKNLKDIDLVFRDSLKNLCIKSICQYSLNATEFTLESELPWILTNQILGNYFKYKWEYSKERASSSIQMVDEDIRCFSLIYLFILDKDMPIKFEDKYCLWMNYYKIYNVNMIVCKDCYSNIKIFNRRYSIHKLRTRNQHFHISRFSRDLIEKVYQNKSFWCQSCFQRVLFLIMSENDCNEEIHNNSRTTKNSFSM